MIPGFTGVNTASPVRLAIWGDPPSNTEQVCVPHHTNTACTGLVLWCTDVFLCNKVTGGNYRIWEESRTPYPCGVCVGVTNPSDW